VFCTRWITRKAGRSREGSVGRAAAARGVRRRRSARVVAPPVKPARVVHGGGSSGEAVREDGFDGRACGGPGVGGRRPGLDRETGFPAGPTQGEAGDRRAGRGRRDGGSPKMLRHRTGARLINPDASLFGARDAGRTFGGSLRATGPEVPPTAIRTTDRGVPPRASGSSGNGRSHEVGVLMRSASRARDRGWSFTAYSLDPEASGNVSAGHVAPTPRSRP
jgi:hypothetical protein